MKSSKSEMLYFILTILMLALAGFLYVFFGNRHQVNSGGQGQIPSGQLAKPEGSDKKDEDVRLAEEHLAKLNDELTSENLGTAQAAIDIVANEDAKASLQKQANVLAAELNNQDKAEELVAQAELYPSYPNLDIAQETVNLLTKENKKTEFQVRLNTVRANLDAYYGQARQ